MAKYKRLHSSKRAEKIICNTLLSIICFVWTVPTIGLLITSFRDREDISRTGWWQAFGEGTRGLTLENYSRVLLGEGFFDSFLNTLTVAVPATFIPILIAAFAAYGFAWIKFRGKKIIFAILIAMLVVPLQISLIPILQDFTRIKLTGTFMSVWFFHASFGLPLAIYLLYNYIAQLPGSILESAFIDGASHFTCFIRLILPLSMPALASFAIFQFLWVWNDLLVALVFLQDTPVLTAQLLNLIGSRGSDWHLLCAGAFVTMIVPLIVFFSLQRYFVKGMLAGSVKG